MNPEPASNPDSAAPEDAERRDVTPRSQDPGLLAKLSIASRIYGLKGIIAPMLWIRDWTDYMRPPPEAPNIVKTYEVRPHLPVRIFFPKSYDQTSPATLPLLLTIHGGGFCIGHVRDDDDWNRAFADGQDVLVVALNYSKAPGAPFPTAVHDLEALILAILADESLPVDRAAQKRSRTAILGFSAGGNLALSVTQLPSIRRHKLAPAAAVSVYGYLDLSVPCGQKLANRPFKPSLPPPRGKDKDGLANMIPLFDWSYVPYGQDLRDPLLSPYYASSDSLPPFVGLVAAELDLLGHESWRLACRLAREGSAAHGRPAAGYQTPDPKSEDAKSRVCGREEVSAGFGRVEVLDETGRPDKRFAFEENWGDGGVKWLLVPDALHGFDNKPLREIMGGEETMKDGEVKTREMMDRLGKWLKGTVWA
ncbi:Alpha/Beta hydrolase protein [Echria macrotheca]|uniref:Alpha/Beta hydrolase protein n=1 Tax=Echria macrotheca TaxID=438768 RepID=A0AAJ0BLV8_9PEZI|nr:Alpha/Beta hydrolase protein [Echria macrotheca]